MAPPVAFSVRMMTTETRTHTQTSQRVSHAFTPSGSGIEKGARKRSSSRVCVHGCGLCVCVDTHFLCVHRGVVETQPPDLKLSAAGLILAAWACETHRHSDTLRPIMFSDVYTHADGVLMSLWVCVCQCQCKDRNSTTHRRREFPFVFRAD